MNKRKIKLFYHKLLSRLLKRKLLLLLCVCVLCYTGSPYFSKLFQKFNPGHHWTLTDRNSYHVFSEKCKIPKLDPFEPEVMSFYHPKKFKPCSTLPPLTSVEFNHTTQLYMLHLHKDRLSLYISADSVAADIDCCYESILRLTKSNNPDFKIAYNKCVHFYSSIQLPSTIDHIIVTCYVPIYLPKLDKNREKKLIYKNGHAMMPERKELRKRLKKWQKKDVKLKKRPPNVLMIGIDSMSSNHLLRSMPMTAQYLYDNDWFEMNGYNKIADNTFPNIMAVTAGLNNTSTDNMCQPQVVGGLDNCTFIWNLFSKYGYVTAFGEDETYMDTFTLGKKGFARPPVDYYLRPYLLAAESRISHDDFCLGSQHFIEAVYDYAIELITRFREEPFFGLFFTNSLSHNDFSKSSALDEKMLDYLKRFEKLGILNNTIIVFFSDHGMRLGEMRKLISNFYEVRLPIVFLWLPPYLKQAHPEFVKTLKLNKNRLTNPYDLHMTMKHFLVLSGRVEDEQQKLLMQPPEDCPRCHSLLEPVAHNRSCSDIAILDHWCTCIPFQDVIEDTKTLRHVAQHTIDYINEFIENFENGSIAKLCVPLKLQQIEKSYYTNIANNGSIDNSITTYRINFSTKPNKAQFGATVRYNEHNHSFVVTSEVSRLNTYKDDSWCIKDSVAKNYCSCHKKKIKVKW